MNLHMWPRTKMELIFTLDHLELYLIHLIDWDFLLLKRKLTLF